MDLMALRNSYEQAIVQIEALESKLRELVDRQKQMVLNGNMSEFDYTQFKISILKGVINMYEQYRDKKWNQLQKQSSISLEEIIYGNVLSPQTLGASYDEDITIHMLPSVLTPIRDLEDLLPSPPGSPTLPDMNIFSRNLLDSSLDDFPMTREL